MPEQSNSSVVIFNGEEIITTINAAGITTTTNLLRLMAKSLVGTSDSPPRFLGYGRGNSTPQKTDKGLQSEISFAEYSRIPLYAVDSRMTTDDKVEVTFIFVDEAQKSHSGIQELGIFQSITGTDCVARVVLDTPIEKDSNNSLEVEWKIVLSCEQPTSIDNQEGDDQ